MSDMQLFLHYNEREKNIVVTMLETKSQTRMEAILTLEDAEVFSENIALAVYKLKKPRQKEADQ